MTFGIRVMLLCASFGLAGCVANPAPAPTMMIVPGKEKNAAAFQQDQSICQQHAMSNTGFGTLPQTAPAPLSGPAAQAGAGGTSGIPGVPAATATPAEQSFVQCMAARGDVVQQMPSMALSGGAYSYSYGPIYPYAYGYPWSYPYYDGFWGGPDLFYRGGFYHGGHWRGGFHGGGHGHGGGHR